MNAIIGFLPFFLFEAPENRKLLLILEKIVVFLTSGYLFKFGFTFFPIKNSFSQTVIIAPVARSTCREIFLVHIELSDRYHVPSDHTQSLILIKFHGPSLFFSRVEVVCHFPDLKLYNYKSDYSKYKF